MQGSGRHGAPGIISSWNACRTGTRSLQWVGECACMLGTPKERPVCGEPVCAHVCWALGAFSHWLGYMVWSQKHEQPRATLGFGINGRFSRSTYRPVTVGRHLFPHFGKAKRFLRL